LFAASMAKLVGLDAQHDIKWVVLSSADVPQQFADGRIDAFIGGPPWTYVERYLATDPQDALQARRTRAPVAIARRQFVRIATA
jgi:ABC-type nitrate/sulfonate/bicarbonate transport system substrate-binding protein